MPLHSSFLAAQGQNFLPQVGRWKGLPLTKASLTLLPGRCCTFVLVLVGAGQLDNAFSMASASLLSLVVEMLMTVVAPPFLIQLEAVVFPPCSFFCSSLSSLLLYILTAPHLWFLIAVLYLATTLVVTNARKVSVWPATCIAMLRSVRKEAFLTQGRSGWQFLSLLYPSSRRMFLFSLSVKADLAMITDLEDIGFA